MIAGSSLFFHMIHMKYVVFMSLWPRTVKILISNWPRTRNFSQFFKNTGARSTSNFYALIGQNLTGEFMRKIVILKLVYFDSWSWQEFRVNLWCFLTVFFHWINKIKYSCYQESSVIHFWFVYWVFGWEMRRLSKFRNPISGGIVFCFSPCLMRKRV